MVVRKRPSFFFALIHKSIRLNEEQSPGPA
jgi:hypothetical protein